MLTKSSHHVFSEFVFKVRIGLRFLRRPRFAMSSAWRFAHHASLQVWIAVLSGWWLGAADGIPFQPPSGWTVSLWASEPMLQNPVSISFDDRGRCYVAETHRWSQSIFDITRHLDWLPQDLSFRTVEDRARFLDQTFKTNAAFLTKDSELVRWLEDRGGVGHADTSGVLASGFQSSVSGTAAGVLARGREVWFACIPDLWKLESTSASGEADKRERIRSGFGVHIGVSGHDLHGLKLGPDGRIYFSIGDRGFDLTRGQEDPDRQNSGPATPWRFSLAQPDTGAVLRCEPDGSRLEVVAIGLRNPQELTFDTDGNLWAGDNDTAGADESRLLYVVEGGDYGWRCSYQHQVGFGPWVQENLWKGGLDDVLPTAGMVSQGPAGFDAYPGTGLGDAWKGHFLMCDFPGGIWDFTVRPNGAGFLLGEKKKWVWGIWPTDVEFGPDGAVYVADWVFGWDKPAKGRIYRLMPQSDPERLSDLKQAAQTREWLAQGGETRSDSDWVKSLDHPDMRVRLRAQTALVEMGPRGFTALLNRVSDPSNPSVEGLKHGLWGVSQAVRTAAHGSRSGGVLSQALLEQAPIRVAERLQDSSSEIRAQACKVLGELRSVQHVQALTERLKDSSPRVRFFAAMSLGQLGRSATSSVSAVLEMVRQTGNGDLYLRHSAVMAMLGIMNVAEVMKLQKDESSAVRLCALLALRRWARPEVKGFLTDADREIAVEAARAIHDVPIAEAMDELAAFLGKVDCPVPMVSRAVDANLRVGQARNATVLANFANRLDVSEQDRVAALEALAEWKRPPDLDRVVGLWRPYQSRSVEPARRALRAVAGSIYAGSVDAVKVAMMRAAVKLEVKEIGNGIADAFEKQPSASESIRKEVLQTLASLRHSSWSSVLKSGLNDPAPEVRSHALRLAAEYPSESVLDLLPRFLSITNPVVVRQSAFAILGRVSGAEAELLRTEWLQRVIQGEVSSDLALDVYEGAGASASEGLRALRTQYESKSTSISGIALSAALLDGGDPARGKNLFFEKVEVSCLRCHRVEGVGGTVGPALDHIGSQRTRGELLESVLRPNAKIAPGFEQLMLRLKNGSAVSGLLRRENDVSIQLENLEDGLMDVPKDQVLSRDRGISAMPEGFEQWLTKREIRDLVAYLASLR